MFKYRGNQIILIIVLFTTLFLPGCWDAIEIDNRAFILGMAIDVFEEDPNMFEITLEVANPKAMTPEGGDDEPSFTLSFTGKTILEATRHIFTQTEKVPTYEHIQVLIIGEDAANKGFDSFFDFMIREFEMRRRTDVVVAKGKGKDIFEKLEPKIAQTKSMYIRSVLEKERFTGLIPSEVHIGTVIAHLRGKKDFILPMIEIEEENAKIEGAAVISKYKLTGWLEPHEVECVKLVRGTLNRALVSVEVAEHKGWVVAFEIMGTDSNITFNMEDKMLKNIDLAINIEGDLGEVKNIEVDTLDLEYLKEIEEYVKDEILKTCNQVVNKAQKELESDIFEFNERLLYREPTFWKENREDWKEIFSQVPINFTIEVKVRRLGLVR